MADRIVRVLKAFNGINQDQNAEEKTRYFVPDNQDTAEEFLSAEEFEYRVKHGFLSVEEVTEPKPLAFRAPQPAEEQTAASTTSSRRRRSAAGQE